MRNALLPILLACALSVATAGDARAQCPAESWSTNWAGGGYAYAMLGFDDGSGPALHVGADGVWRYSGGAWTELYGLFGSIGNGVGALGVFDDGTGLALYAGGEFDTPFQGIAKWTGFGWVPLSGGLDYTGNYLWVDAMCTFDDGTGPGLFIGGRFDRGYNAWPNHVTSHSILKWDGTNWSSVAGGISSSPAADPRVYALAVYDDGTGPALYAGGNFTGMGGVAANYIAKWNGTTWSALGTGLDSYVYALAVHNDGSGPSLYALGTFHTAGGIATHGPARWNGTVWSAVGSNTTLTGGNALAVFDSGIGPALYAACDGSADGHSFNNLCRWDGQHWSSLGGGVPSGEIWSLAVFDDLSGGGPDLYVSGNFNFVGGNVPSWDFAEWYGCNAQVAAICPGDGTFGACPCSNYGASGRGCGNSTGLGGALLSSSGTTNPDTFGLSSGYELATALSIFVLGDAETATPQRFGDGLRCVGGSLLRMYVHAAVGGVASAPQAGEPTVSQRAANLGFPIAPGDVRYFQVYYRDSVQTFCAPNTTTFNISNALRVIW